MKNKKLRSLIMKKVSPSSSLGAIIGNVNRTTKFCYDNSSSKPLQLFFYATSSTTIKDWSHFLNTIPSYNNDDFLYLDFKDFINQDITDPKKKGYNIYVYFFPPGADVFNSKVGINLNELDHDLTPSNISTYDPCPDSSYDIYYNSILIMMYSNQPKIDIKNYTYNGQTFNGIGGNVRLFIELTRAYTDEYLGSFYI